MNPIISNQMNRLRPLMDYVRKKQENQRFLKSLEITATFVLIIFFLIFAIRPTALTISSLVGEIKSKQILKTQLKTKIDKVVAAQEVFSEVQEHYQIVNDSLPDTPQFYQAANQIQKSGQDAGLNISTLQYGFQNNSKKSIDPNVGIYTISLNIEGQFNSAVKLVSELLKNRRLININSIGVGVTRGIAASESTESAAPSGSVSTDFTANFYYWSPKTNDQK